MLCDGVSIITCAVLHLLPHSKCQQATWQSAKVQPNDGQCTFGLAPWQSAKMQWHNQHMCATMASQPTTHKWFMTNALQSEVQAQRCKQTGIVAHANVQTCMFCNVHKLGRDAYLLAKVCFCCLVHRACLIRHVNMCVHGMTNDLQSEVQAQSCKQTKGMFAQLSQKASSKVASPKLQANKGDVCPAVPEGIF